MSEMSTARRVLLKRVLAALPMLLLNWRAVWALRPEQAFASKSVDEAINALLQGEAVTDSSEITLKAPDIAENGAVVPISIKTDLDAVESISIIVEKNPNPLAASFQLSAKTRAEVSTRIKMAETSRVIALVRANGKFYATQKEIKVTIGGCGG